MLTTDKNARQVHLYGANPSFVFLFRQGWLWLYYMSWNFRRVLAAQLEVESDISHQLVKSQRHFSLFLNGLVQLELKWSSLCNKLPWHLTFEWNFVFLDSIHIKWFKKWTPFLRHKAHTHPGGSYKACQVVFNSFVSQPPYTVFVTGQLIQIWYYLQLRVWAGVSVCIHYP